MPDNLRNVLVRVYDMSMRRNHGNVVVAEINFRRVEQRSATPMLPQLSCRGAVLIDSSGALGPIANLVRQCIGFLVYVRSTDELLWLPLRAEMSVGDYWTIEMVPWIEYLRACSLPDDEIIRRAHADASGDNN